MQEFKKYPIYKFKISWTDKNGNEDSLSSEKMFKEDQTPEQLKLYKDELWNDLQNYRKIEGGELLDFEISFWERNSWCLGWFNHYTLDDGEDDQYFLDSFDDFVTNTEQEIYNHERNGDMYYRTLMGANDRWRWRGETEDDPAPCRCEGCKKHGLVRIGH